MPDNANDRVQLILALVTFAALGLGLVLSGFLWARRWQASRRQRLALAGYGHTAEPVEQPHANAPSTDPYAIAQEALKLVDTVTAENERLRAQLAKHEAKHPHGGTMPAREWLAIVNDAPDLVPHIGIEGASRTGKTTLAEGILQEREGQILIITAKTGDEWGGLPYVTVDDNGSFTTAGAIFRALHREVLHRLVATKHRQAPGEWLTVVLDDYPALRDACPEANEPFLLVARIGASLRVRLMVLTYSRSVKELGLEGKGDARHHFAWIKRTRHGSERTAVMEWEGLPYDLETGPVVQLARRPLDSARAWQAETTAEDYTPPAKRPARGIVTRLFSRKPPTATQDADALLRRFLSEPTEQHPPVLTLIPAHEGQNTPSRDTQEQDGIAGIARPDADTGIVPSDTGSGDNTTQHPRDLPDEVIRALATGEQWSGNRIAKYLYGAKQKRIQRIERALKTEETLEEAETIKAA